MEDLAGGDDEEITDDGWFLLCSSNFVVDFGLVHSVASAYIQDYNYQALTMQSIPFGDHCLYLQARMLTEPSPVKTHPMIHTA